MALIANRGPPDRASCGIIAAVVLSDGRRGDVDAGRGDYCRPRFRGIVATADDRRAHVSAEGQVAMQLPLLLGPIEAAQR